MKNQQVISSKKPARAKQREVAPSVSVPVGLSAGKGDASGASPSLVCFSLKAPGAAKVCVAGSFNAWNPGAMPMSRSAEGAWISHADLKPGRYEYRFVVDGDWQEDPAATAFNPNPFGERNSVIVVT